jgi:hypothetical protein
MRNGVMSLKSGYALKQHLLLQKPSDQQHHSFTALIKRYAIPKGPNCI